MSAPVTSSSPFYDVLKFVWDQFVQPNLERGVVWGWKAAQWQRAASRYSAKLEQDYGKLFVLGQPEPRPIDGIYTYVNVLEKTSPALPLPSSPAHLLTQSKVVLG